MEPFDHLGEHGHHIVALFRNERDAAVAIERLHEVGVSNERLSILTLHGNERPPSEASSETMRGVVAGGATGGAIGFVAGAIAFGLPGVGAVVGAGLWAATTVGIALGATAGLELSDYHRVWEGQYRSAVAEGDTLVAVSTDDALVAAKAREQFENVGAKQVDHFDRHGTRHANSSTV